MLGGLNVHLISLMEHARSHGWQVSALLNDGSAGLKVMQTLKQMNHSVEAVGLYRKHYSEANIGKSIDRWLAKIQPDVIHLHDGSPRSNLLAKEVGVASGVPVYSSVHFVPRELALADKELERLKKAFLSLRGVILNSRYCAEILQSHGLTCEREAQIYYGVCTRGGMAHSTTFAQGEPCRILAIARAETRKGLQLLLEIFAGFVRRGYFSWRLTLAGDYEPNVLRNWLDRLSIPEEFVNLIGWHDDFRSCYGAHDLLVMCSTDEGTPISLLEALAIGMPVIASRLEGTTELLRGSDCCELLPSHDLPTWSSAIHSFVQSPKFLQQRASYGPALVRAHYDEFHQLGKVLQFVQSNVIHEGGRSNGKSSPASTSICLCVCTRSDASASRFLDANRVFVSFFERFVVMVNGIDADAASTLSQEEGVELLRSKAITNLADARNYVLELSEQQYVLFVDDDVRLNISAVYGIRTACETGFDVVGARLLAPAWVRSGRWFFSSAQYHYLGLHRPDDPLPPIWGACMAVRRKFLADFGLRFRSELGRSGTQLQSGDDTTLVREVIARGGQTVVPPQVEVQHEISSRRCSLAYLIRRAYWQGRSEVRRHASLAGLRKETQRNFGASSTFKCHLLAGLYTVAVAWGVALETFLSCLRIFQSKDEN